MKCCSQPFTACPPLSSNSDREQTAFCHNSFKAMRRRSSSFDGVCSDDDAVVVQNKRQKVDVTNDDSNCCNDLSESRDTEWQSFVKVKQNAQSRVSTHTTNLKKYQPDAFTTELMLGTLKTEEARYALLIDRNDDNALRTKLGQDYKKIAFVKDLSKVPASVAKNIEAGTACKITGMNKETVLKHRGTMWPKLEYVPNLTKQDALQHEFKNRMLKNGVPESRIPACYFDNKKHAIANNLKMTKNPTWFDIRKQLRCSPKILKSFLDYALKTAKESLPEEAYSEEKNDFEVIGIANKSTEFFSKEKNFFEDYADVANNDTKNEIYEWLYDLKTANETKKEFYDRGTFNHIHYPHGDGYFCLCGHVMKTSADHVPFDLQDRYESFSDDEAPPSKFRLKLQKSEHLANIAYEKWKIEEKLKEKISDAEVNFLKRRLSYYAEEKEDAEKNHLDYLKDLKTEKWNIEMKLNKNISDAEVKHLKKKLFVLAKDKEDAEKNHLAHLNNISHAKLHIEAKLKKNISDAEVKHLKEKLVFLAKDKEHVQKNNDRLVPQQWGSTLLQKASNAAPVITSKQDIDEEIFASDDNEDDDKWGHEALSEPEYLRENKACSSSVQGSSNFEEEEDFDAGF